MAMTPGPVTRFRDAPHELPTTPGPYRVRTHHDRCDAPWNKASRPQSTFTRGSFKPILQFRKGAGRTVRDSPKDPVDTSDPGRTMLDIPSRVRVHVETLLAAQNYMGVCDAIEQLSLIHISEPTRPLYI